MSRAPRPVSWLLLLLALGAGALAWGRLSGGAGADAPPLHGVGRGPLRVTVLESGSLEALESLSIVSRVEGQAAIVYLVEEGTVLTEQDVADGRVLVRLDTSELDERLAKQDIDVQSARAATVNAATSLEIQQKEDASKERQAVLKVEFARLDLRRSVGEAVADLAEGLRRRADRAEPPADGAAAAAELAALIRGLLERADLKGETLQRLRQLRSDISLADEELKRAEVKWEWSRRLLAKDFVSRDEEDADRLAVERRRIEKERAETAFQQYAVYDAPKEATRLLSDLVEAEGELQRVRDRARAAQQRATAELEAKREQQELQERRFEKLKEQRAACVIRAPKPGLVLYASSSGERAYDDSRRIAEGAQVRERQAILTLPDTAQMGVRINVHESAMDRMRPGLPATVTVESGVDRPIVGVVHQVKHLPNPNDRWMNPDLKLYATLIRLTDPPPGLKPGLTARAEILVEQLDAVLTVPVQCVTGAVGRPAVWVWDGSAAAERRVRLGSSNDRFVVVLEGLEEGERVLLAPPRSAAPAAGPAPGPGPGSGVAPAAGAGPAAASASPPGAAPAGAPAGAGGERPRRSRP